MAVLLPAGCGFNPAAIPVPGASVSGPTYEIRIEFTNALNLPAQAKVVANGAKIGSLRSVTVVDPGPNTPGRIDAVVEISAAVRLPTTTTAQLRQSTILGDIYIGLTTPATDFDKTIPPGGVIPLARTEPPLQVEDLLAGMSTFVGGGALHQFQEIVNQTNAVLPQRVQETRRIFDTIGRDVQDLAGNQGSVDAFLTAIEADLAAVSDNQPELDALLSERGAVDIPADAQSLVLTLGIVGALGSIGHAVEWLGPLLRSGDATAKALVPLLFANQPLDLSAPSNLNRLTALLRDKIIPFVERGPKVNITGVRIEGGASSVAKEDQVDAMVRALRMIGMVR
ncbi:MCE family protein [Nocardia uniformis]|uniref:MCE family protein n=2 Tax=Nocardia uniformis TaxID=53432 RepID=A0A849C202_9NOCA|nr:MCE family protein [Nocardia uniformis]